MKTDKKILSGVGGAIALTAMAVSLCAAMFFGGDADSTITQSEISEEPLPISSTSTTLSTAIVTTSTTTMLTESSTTTMTATTEITTTVAVPVTAAVEPEAVVSSSNVLECNAVYYHAPAGSYGAAGVVLTPNYSVACNFLPLGTQIYVTSDSGAVPSGTYCVQDRGTAWQLSVNYIDFFYTSYGEMTTDFAQAGVVPIHVEVLE